MKAAHIDSYLVDYVDGALSEKRVTEVEQHLQECDRCSAELKEIRFLFEAFDKVKEDKPSEKVRAGFYEMLAEQKQLQHKVVPLMAPKNKSWKKVLQIAAAIVFVLSGFVFGRYQQNQEYSDELSQLKENSLEMEHSRMLALADNRSASKRLQAVSLALKFDEPGNEILNALINKMHYDDHVNVRLAAAEALAKFSDSEMVRKALISALDMEQDPSMQIELIQILVEIQEKRAVPSMEKLLRNEETVDYVKDQLQIGLPNLI